MVPHGESTCAAQKLPMTPCSCLPRGLSGLSRDQQGRMEQFCFPPNDPQPHHPTPSPSRLRKGKEARRGKTNTVLSKRVRWMLDLDCASSMAGRCRSGGFASCHISKSDLGFPLHLAGIFILIVYLILSLLFVNNSRSNAFLCFPALRLVPWNQHRRRNGSRISLTTRTVFFPASDGMCGFPISGRSCMVEIIKFMHDLPLARFWLSSSIAMCKIRWLNSSIWGIALFTESTRLVESLI
ncbi:hypothetical protein GGI42DRAFT_243840 [Trichoderma sp. SZMC 28013]